MKRVRYKREILSPVREEFGQVEEGERREEEDRVAAFDAVDKSTLRDGTPKTRARTWLRYNVPVGLFLSTAAL